MITREKYNVYIIVITIIQSYLIINNFRKQYILNANKILFFSYYISKNLNDLGKPQQII